MVNGLPHWPGPRDALGRQAVERLRRRLQIEAGLAADSCMRCGFIAGPCRRRISACSSLNMMASDAQREADDDREDGDELLRGRRICRPA